jgi:hypothetical protein
MTRIRVPYRGLGLIAAAVASVMSPNVFSQPGRATLIGITGNPYCDYSSILTYKDGKVDITCSPVVPGAPGQLGFSAASFPLAKADAVASVNFNVTVQRLGGITGAASATVNAAAPCGPASQPIAFSDGIGGAANVPLTVSGSNTATCALSLTSVTGATEGVLTSSVVITPPPPSGGDIIAGCEGKTPTSNFVQHPGFFGIAGMAVPFSEVGNGRIHSWALPKTAAGAQVPSGIIVHTSTPLTPGTLKIEWSISKCPGDTAYYNTTEATVSGRGGVVYKPCGSETGWESGGVKWNALGGTAQCKVPTTETWYVNVRYTQGCSGSCPVYFAWQVN